MGLPEAPGTAGELGGGEAPDPASIPALSPEPVVSVEELPGTYYRPFALPTQVSVLDLGPIEQGDGAYSLYRSCGVPTCIPEAGSYHAVGQNPAVGFAFLSLAPAGTTGVTDTYLLDFFWRDDRGAIVAVQMRRLLPGDVVGAPFAMWRVPEDEPPVDRQALEATAPPARPTALAANGDDAPVPGLASVYVRPLPPPGELGALTLGEPTWSGDFALGEYRVARPYCLPWCFPELGHYELEVIAPATGTARLTLYPAADPSAATEYLVDGVWRNPVGGIVALQLQRRYASGALGLPFFLYRQWWDTDSVDATSLPDEPPLPQGAGPLCTYYQNLEVYYRTRALQCAYSACYPLSSWYLWWANYYRDQALEACE